MKRLDEIVQVLLHERNLAFELKVGGGVSTEQQLAMLLKDGVERQVKMVKRLHDDPALRVLIDMASHVVLVMARIPAQDDVKLRGYMQLLVEVIELWEDAHREFEEQLKEKP